MALTSYNEVAIKSKIQNALKQQQYVNFARQAANTRFVFAKRELIDDFDQHPITEELHNKDKEGSALVSKGNLFSFLGFFNQDEPADKLREYLLKNTVMINNATITTDNKKIYYTFKVQVPSKTQIYNAPQLATPDHWSSRGWVQLIEQGVGNAAYYIFLFSGILAKSGSRSHFGLQLKAKDGSNQKTKSGGSFTPMTYVSTLIDNFIERFK